VQEEYSLFVIPNRDSRLTALELAWPKRVGIINATNMFSDLRKLVAFNELVAAQRLIMIKIFSLEGQLPGNSRNNFLPQQIPVLQQTKTLLLSVATLNYEQISIIPGEKFMQQDSEQE